MGDKLIDEYYKWLIYMIMRSKNHEYDLLCKDLYGTKFRWLIDNDVNRAFEGVALRENFCTFMGVDIRDFTFRGEAIDSELGANVLEVLIGIALRCEWVVMDDVNNLDICYWFRKLLCNLELDLFTDNGYYDHGGKEKVGLILDRFMNRTYSKNGKGGLFPLKGCCKNQRNIEIWYQMNTYLVENYYVE